MQIVWLLLRHNAACLAVAVEFGCLSKFSSFEVYDCDRVGEGDADNVDVNVRLGPERKNCKNRNHIWMNAHIILQMWYYN